MDNETKKNANKGAAFWMFVPVILLVCSVGGWLVMVRVAVDDPGFSVEADYYKKASRFDVEMAQRSMNARLGYRANVESFSFIAKEEAELVVRLLDRQGNSVSDAGVTGQAFFNARAGDIHQVTFFGLGDGRYSARLVRPHLGLWEVRLSVERGELFSAVLRPELVAHPPGGPES